MNAPLARLVVLALVFTVATAPLLQAAPIESAPVELNLSSAANVLQQAMSAQEWQSRYNRATADKKSGKKKMWIAAGLFGAAIVSGGASTNSCRNGKRCGGGAEAGWVLAGLMDLGATVSFVWGLVQRNYANGELNRLENSRPAGVTPRTSFRLTDDKSVALTLTSQTQAAAFRIGF